MFSFSRRIFWCPYDNFLPNFEVEIHEEYKIQKINKNSFEVISPWAFKCPSVSQCSLCSNIDRERIYRRTLMYRVALYSWPYYIVLQQVSTLNWSGYDGGSNVNEFCGKEVILRDATITGEDDLKVMERIRFVKSVPFYKWVITNWIQ